MALFQIGDHVERIGTLVPEYMRFGQIVRVIPHPDLPEHMTEYEVDFKIHVGQFYQTQLRLVERPPGDESSVPKPLVGS